MERRPRADPSSPRGLGVRLEVGLPALSPRSGGSSSLYGARRPTAGASLPPYSPPPRPRTVLGTCARHCSISTLESLFHLKIICRYCYWKGIKYEISLGRTDRLNYWIFFFKSRFHYNAKYLFQLASHSHAEIEESSICR